MVQCVRGNALDHCGKTRMLPICRPRPAVIVAVIGVAPTSPRSRRPGNLSDLWTCSYSRQDHIQRLVIRLEHFGPVSSSPWVSLPRNASQKIDEVSSRVGTMRG